MNPVPAGGSNVAWASFVFALLSAVLILLNPYAVYAGPRFSLAASPGPWIPLAAVLSIAAFAYSCHRLKSPVYSPDVSRSTAGVLLFLLLALAAWMRFAHFGSPLGAYINDNGTEIIDALNIHDLGEHRIMFIVGAREPGFAYWAQFFFALFPDMPLYQVQHVVSASIDLATIVALYFLGREWAGRRAGLLAAALAVFSRTLVMKVLLGLRMILLPLAVAFVLWAFLRLIRRPTFARFSIWVLGMAAGAYTFTSFRSFIPFLILTLLIWILTDPEEREAARRNGVLVASVLLGVCLASLWISGFFGMDHVVPDVLRLRVVAPTILGGVIFFGWVSNKESLMTDRGLLRNWIRGVPFIFLLALPILSQFWIINHAAAQGLGIEMGRQNLNPAVIKPMFEALLRTSGSLFFSSKDTIDYSISGDSFFDSPIVVLFVLGLAFLLTRPSWKLFFLFVCVGVGSAAHILSYQHHSGKMLGSVAPVLVMASWGCLGWWEAFQTRVKGWGRVLPGLILLGLLGWGAVAGYDRVYHGWIFDEKHQEFDVRLALEAWKDADKNQVFFTKFHRYYANITVQNSLQDGRDVRILGESNLLFVYPGETARDVVLFCMPKDEEVMERIRREFPKAEWKEVYRFVPGPGQGEPKFPLRINRVFIPKETIPATPGKLFWVFAVPEAGWVRSFYDGRCGMGHGVILKEDWVASSDALTPTQGEWVVVRYEKEIKIGGETRRIRFRSDKSADRVHLKVDGKRVFKAAPGHGGSGVVRLGQGTHRVEFLVHHGGGEKAQALYFRDGKMAEIRFR